MHSVGCAQGVGEEEDREREERGRRWGRCSCDVPVSWCYHMWPTEK